jgi:hypothetical protein
MLDFSSITSLKAAEGAWREGHLKRALLLPAELGGQDCPENIVYITPHAWDLKINSTTELLDAVRKGMNNVTAVPEYRGTSFVPIKITMTAGDLGMSPVFKLEIAIW